MDLLTLKNLNVKIGVGQFIGVLGKVGSGKSTLINAILCETGVHEDNNTRI